MLPLYCHHLFHSLSFCALAIKVFSTVKYFSVNLVDNFTHLRSSFFSETCETSRSSNALDVLAISQLKFLFRVSPNTHSVKSVRIRGYSGLYFPAFGLNTERYEVSLHIQSEYGKMRTIITPNTDTFHAVYP